MHQCQNKITKCFLNMRKISTSTSVNRLRSEWRKDRSPANTRLGEANIVEERKAFGGRKKFKGVEIFTSDYTLQSKNVRGTMKILDVIQSDAGTHFKEKKIMTKGVVVAVDISSLKDKITAQDILPEEMSDETVRYKLNEMLESGQLYARISSRPGQVGNCDGYIIEGKEFVDVFEKLQESSITP